MVRSRNEKVGRPRKEETGKKDLEILKRLALKGALKGALNCNQISREGPRIVISYPTVWRRLQADGDSLLKEGYVSKGREPGTYTLTGSGLLKLVSQYSENLGSQISQVVERWSSLLPSFHYLFTKWSYLKKRGLETEAIWILKTYGPLADQLRHLKSEDEQSQLDRTLKVTLFTYLFGAQGPSTTLTWCKAIRDDPELKNWTIANLNDEMNVIRDLTEFFRQMLQTIESPEEPDLDGIQGITKSVTHASTLATVHAITALSILTMVHARAVHPELGLTRQDSRQL